MASWPSQPAISARSVLVTILGDVVRPLGRSVWLSELFDLCEPFGFSSRLVRTSLFRLAADGWVESLREGRRSRYSLTPLALGESAAADERIYADDYPAWDGSWSILVVDRARCGAKRLERLVGHLRWQGFTPIAQGILVAPSVSGSKTLELLSLIEPEIPVALGEARFDNVGRLLALSPFADPFNRQDIEDGFTGFVGVYEPLAADDHTGTEPRLAYALRVALVHDRRRIVLRSPAPPRELLPEPWVGDRAFGVAARLYRSLSEPSAQWLSQVLEVRYPASLPDRYSTVGANCAAG